MLLPRHLIYGPTSTLRATVKRVGGMLFVVSTQVTVMFNSGVILKVFVWQR